MYSQKRSNRRNKRPLMLLAITLALVFLISGVLYYRQRTNTTSQSPAATGTQPDTSKIDLSPPTEQELRDTETHKDSLNNPAPPPVVDQSGKLQVSPVITSASQNEVRAYISGVFEDNGMCTATYRNGSTSFTKQSAGFKNVNTTNCEVLTTTRSDFSFSGEWSVTVSYSSANAVGSSKTSSFEVQE